jgi:hypothetical protein
MKQAESNYLNMVQSLLANLRKDQAFWSGEPEIVSEVNAIESEFNLVNESLNLVSGLDPTGYTKSKNSTFDSIIRATYKLCRRLCVYARRQNDPLLLQFADHSENSLSAGIEKAAINRCSALVNKAETIIDALASYKITADDLASIRQLIEAYNQHLEGRSTVKTSKTVSIHDISDQINSLNNRLILLDDMIEGFIDDDDMIARYKAARIVINYGKGKTAKNKAESTSAEASAN